MKKLLSVLFSLLFLCSALFSCGDSTAPGDSSSRENIISPGDGASSEDSPSSGNSTASAPELTLSAGGFFIYRDLYFYKARSVKGDDESSTLQYISLSSDETVGAPVYSDVLNEGEDLFNPKGMKGISLSDFIEVVVDEEATEENGGVPVLIAALPFVKEGERDFFYRVVSYNMATGQTNVLCENIGDRVGSFGLYGDAIYYTQLKGKIDILDIHIPTVKTNGKCSLFSLPKTGGKPEKLFTTTNDNLELQASWKGKLYLRAYDTHQIYRYDPAKKTAEAVSKFKKESEYSIYVGGYVYYRGNVQVLKKEGYIDLPVFDLYRQPLENLKDLTEENGERILEDLCRAEFTFGKNFCYIKADECNPYRDARFDCSIVHYYDTETKESGIVYDYSATRGVLWMMNGIGEEYFLISSTDEKYNLVWQESIVNRKTGERRVLEDWYWYS